MGAPIAAAIGTAIAAMDAYMVKEAGKPSGQKEQPQQQGGGEASHAVNEKKAEAPSQSRGGSNVGNRNSGEGTMLTGGSAVNSQTTEKPTLLGS
jgi:hypothetical protein